MRLEAGTTQLPDRANFSDVTGGESRRGAIYEMAYDGRSRAHGVGHFWISCIGLGSGVIFDIGYEDYG